IEVACSQAWRPQYQSRDFRDEFGRVYLARRIQVVVGRLRSKVGHRRRGFLVSPLLALLISEPQQDTSRHRRNPAGQTRLTHHREGQPRAGANGGGALASSIIEEASENP